jgi:hypothetical protein
MDNPGVGMFEIAVLFVMLWAVVRSVTGGPLEPKDITINTRKKE